MKMGNKRKSRIVMTIRFRMTAIFLGVMVVLMLINVYIYMNVNRVVMDINQVYIKNFRLNILQDELQNIQDCMTQYLENKNTDSMENYYRNVQIYSDTLDELNSKTVDDEYMLMEKNIYNLSKAYIDVTDETIEYKRGRNVEKYSYTYEKTVRMCGYLNTYIESLNNSRFKANSANYQAMLRIFYYTQQLSIGILFVVAVITIVLISLATRQITLPLTRLAAAANKVASGTLDVEPVEIISEDEVGVVTGAFNKMLLSIREYIDRIKDNMERERALQDRELLMNTHLKEAQLNYLQAQINPHFLFNTLNAGAQLAMMEEADRTYKYIQNVADFYRYNVQNNKVVTLENEIELVDNYMYIINVRYSNDIHYSKDIDTSLTSVMIPAMIIQPIVENSVRYGISGIDWEAHIDLSVTLEDDYICVSIRDNGVGIPKETIDSIMSEEIKVNYEETKEDSTGVGLRNVIARMRLYYNTEDVMEITSEGVNLGTEIALMIPFSE